MLLFKTYQWIFMALSIRPKDHNIAQKSFVSVALSFNNFLTQPLHFPFIQYCGHMEPIIASRMWGSLPWDASLRL